MNASLRPYLPFLFVVVLLVGVTIGLQLAPMTAGKDGMFASRDRGRLEEIMGFIDYNYVDTVNTRRLMDELVTEYLDRDEVIQDVFERLDPHSNYIPAASMRAETESLEGRFEGIGIEFNIVRDTILVVSPISGGPSEALGIRSGDRIVTVEDSVVAGVGVTENDVRRLLRGPKGSVVHVGIRRSGEPELISFAITRDRIPLFSLDAAYLVDSITGYVKLNRFSRTTTEEFTAALDALGDQGMQRLMLDLRGNPGGFLFAATQVADELLSGRKRIVYTSGKASPREDYFAGREGAFERGDLIVLIDEGSASASEIVAGAVQDHRRGLIVGRRSFGKGLVQEIFSLPDSSAIRLTVARYYTPGGRCIQRPYDEGTEAYYEQYWERLAAGGELPDSLADLPAADFGIHPDVVVHADTSSDRRAFYRLYNTGRPQRFAYDLYGRDMAGIRAYDGPVAFAEGYRLDAADWNAFRRSLRGTPADPDEATWARIRPWVETAILAHVARQAWQSGGFFPVFNRIDPEFGAAYALFRDGTYRERIEAAGPVSVAAR